MHYSPVLWLHIAAGTIGLFAGATAAVFRKGGRRHGLAGDVFVIAMTALGATGAFMAILKSQPGNILGGTITIYLVLTAWWTARRAERGTSVFDWAGLLVVATIAAVEWTCAIKAMRSPTGEFLDYPPGPWIMLGTVALLATMGDIRLLVRGGIAGSQRLARHLWRMCFALFVASGSIFLARAHLFPMFMRKTGMLYMLTVAPIVLMIFWLVRVKVAKRYKPMQPQTATAVGD